MKELKLIEMMGSVDEELLLRANAPVPLHSKPRFRIAVSVAAVAMLLVLTMVASPVAVAVSYGNAHPEIEGGLVYVMDAMLKDEEHFLSSLLPEGVKHSLGSVFDALKGGGGQGEGSTEREPVTSDPTPETTEPPSEQSSEEQTQEPIEETTEQTTEQTTEETEQTEETTEQSSEEQTSEPTHETTPDTEKEPDTEPETEPVPDVPDPADYLEFRLLPNNTYAVKWLKKDTSDVIIPDEYEGLPVTVIEANAFATKRINYLTIGDNVTSIGESAFRACSSLYEVHIGAGVTEIGSNAFSDCTKLMTITVSGDNTAYYVFEDVLYRSEDHALIHAPRRLKGSVTIPDGVTCIPPEAFKGTSIKELYIPDSVLEIGYGAFSSCSHLRSVRLSASLQSIPSYAFEACTMLNEIIIPDGVEEIAPYAFKHSGLQSITIPDSVREIGEYAFWGCTDMTAIYVGSGVTHIASTALQEVSALQSMTVSTDNPIYTAKNNCLIDKSTGTLLFALPGATIPDDGSVTAIAPHAFENVTTLTEITIPASVTQIGDYAFAGCTKLSRVTLTDGLQRIGAYCFLSCEMLIDISIPDSVIEIGNNAFESSRLQHIKLSSNLREISPYMLAMTNINEIEVPASVVSIGEMAFYSCLYLSRVTLHEGLEVIGNDAFSGCMRVTEIKLPSTLTALKYAALNGIWAQEIVIPEGVVELGEYAISGFATTSLTLPTTLTNVHRNAIYGWNVENDIYYNGTLEQWQALMQSTDLYLGYEQRIVCSDGVYEQTYVMQG